MRERFRLAPADRMDDLEPIPGGKPIFGEKTARHHLLVDLDRQTLAFDAEIFEQPFKGRIRPDRSGFSVQDNFHRPSFFQENLPEAIRSMVGFFGTRSSSLGERSSGERLDHPTRPAHSIEGGRVEEKSSGDPFDVRSSEICG